ncbi:hypothetical protein L7F22_021857 [Adiantum nelumboides]|nr:hypothetical protein [Adiantum nelumboides]
MDKDEWEELDELACSTIMLTLAESIYFNVAEETTAYGVWQKLCSLYEKQSAASQIYWLKKLVELKMKEGTAMSNHLNEFHIIFGEYINKVLQHFNMDREKALLTPLPSYVKLSNQDCPQSEVEKVEMDKVLYASASGSLMYAMIATCPDIAFAMGVVSRYVSNPDKKHWEAVKGIMRPLLLIMMRMGFQRVQQMVADVEERREQVVILVDRELLVMEVFLEWMQVEKVLLEKKEEQVEQLEKREVD